MTAPAKVLPIRSGLPPAPPVHVPCPCRVCRCQRQARRERNARRRARVLAWCAWWDRTVETWWGLALACGGVLVIGVVFAWLAAPGGPK